MCARNTSERPEQRAKRNEADGSLLLTRQGPQASPLGRLRTLTLNSPSLSEEQFSMATILRHQNKTELLSPPHDELSVDGLY